MINDNIKYEIKSSKDPADTLFYYTYINYYISGLNTAEAGLGYVSTHKTPSLATRLQESPHRGFFSRYRSA